jgi:hypothetical protein
MPAEETGIDFENRLAGDNVKRYLDSGSGVAWGDYDSDGRVDLFLNGLETPGRLFRQTDHWRFEDVTERAGIDTGPRWGTGAAFADLDNDGDLDLMVCNLGSKNLLYQNQGDGTFEERSVAAGLAYNGGSIMPSFADYDLDGDLDLYLVTYRVFHHTEEAEHIALDLVDGKPAVPDNLRDQLVIIDGNFNEAGHADVMYRNDGEGRFTKVTRSAGLHAFNAGLSATWFDYDSDGDPDLYVANDFMGPDHLYRNLGGGDFEDVLPQVAPVSGWFSMGSDAGDLNNDGLLDLLVVDMDGLSHEYRMTKVSTVVSERWFLARGNRPQQYSRNALLLNAGNGRFLEAAQLAGIDRSGWSWAARIADLDNDGRSDIFITNGSERDLNDMDVREEFDRLYEAQTDDHELNQLAYGTPRLIQPNQAFRNRGDLRFENVSRQWGLDLPGVSHGAATADIDRDGDLDMVVNNLNAPVAVYRNQSHGQHRILLRLRGTESHRSGAGARVEIHTADGLQVREMRLARGYQGSDEGLIHFGLGTAQRVDRLVVRWPAGAVQDFEDLDADHEYTITEPGGVPDPAVDNDGGPPMFESAKGRLAHRSVEDAFNDFSDSTLLPRRLSREGPGMAWCDLDRDQRPELLIGGPANQATVLMSRDQGGRFQVQPSGALGEAKRREDMGLLCFEADGDGHVDLYVASGGPQAKEGGEPYKDRLYLGSPDGFRVAPEESLPDLRHSGSQVAAADLDRDGDLDLFVGSRAVPGGFPKLPPSHLLLNENGRFSDATRRIAPGLLEAGMVVSALWSDANSDGWPDLILATDWGPPRVFLNEEGRLMDRTAESGLQAYTGLWRGIAAGDVDADGDLDYLIGNLGANSPYRPTANAPVRLYAKDVYGDPRLELVESYFDGGRELPRWTRNRAYDGLPALVGRFETHREYGQASIPQIYQGYDLQQWSRRELRHVHTSLLLNDGDAGFRVQPLARMAQLAPSNGVALVDVDLDGALDAVLAQNDSSFHPETGEIASGLSQLLLGDGQGGFEPVWPHRSGISVPGDARSLTPPDLDGDGRQDLVFGVNDGPMVSYLNRSPTRGEALILRLRGDAGNPHGIGAGLLLTDASGRRRAAEVYAGGGLLSQDLPQSWLAVRPTDLPATVRVSWPDGSVSEHTTESAGVVTLAAN